MEFIILGLCTALGKFIVLSKVFGLPRIIWAEKFIDVLFAVVLPLLFLGTFSGAILAVFSGLWLSLILRITALFVKPQPPRWWPSRKVSTPSRRK